MNPTLERVRAHCEDRRWPCTPLADRPVLEVSFDLGWTRWSAFVKAEDDASVVTIRSLYPKKVPLERRAAVAEYLTRANFGLRVGNFEMDYADGETRFKTGLDLNGAPLTDALVEALFDANTDAYQRYVSGLTAVVAGEATPEDAVREAENPW